MPTLTPPLSRTHAAMLTAACEAMCDDTALLVLADCEQEEGESERRVAWLRGLEKLLWVKTIGEPLWRLVKPHCYLREAVAIASHTAWHAFGKFGSVIHIGKGEVATLAEAKRAAWACLIREGGRT